MVEINNLDELYESQKELAKDIFDSAGEIFPMWIGQDAAGKIYPITVAALDEDTKPKLSGALKAFFKEHGIIRYVSVLESWMVSVKLPEGQRTHDPKVDGEKALGGLMPTQHPDRIEVVMLAGEEAGRHIFGYYKIVREEGKVYLGEFVDEKTKEGAMATGLFTDLLPVKSKSVH